HKTNVEAQGTDDLLGLLMFKGCLPIWWDGKLDSKLENYILLISYYFYVRVIELTANVLRIGRMDKEHVKYVLVLQLIFKIRHSPEILGLSMIKPRVENQDTIKQQRTRSGRNIPDYQEFFEQESTDGDESSLQENEEETSEKGLDIDSFEDLSKENSEKEPVRDDVIKDILGITIDYSDATKEILLTYKEQDSDGDLIDLRLNSSFFKKLPKTLARSYLMEMDSITESLVPVNVHEFLVKFFSQNLTAKEWNYQIDDLRAPEKDDFIMSAVVRVLRRTLPQFIKAFSLEDQNPLLNITTIEHAHLNAFVHPCLDTFL
ncbi:5423_t:CDS:2, partial [Acaulospora morrowiae]